MIEIMLQNIRKLRKEVRDLQEQIAVLEDKTRLRPRMTTGLTLRVMPHAEAK